MNKIVARESNEAPAELQDHLYLAFAPAYVFGAKKQITRYKNASRLLTQYPVLGVFECLHEASNLLEDLSMIKWYARLSGMKTAQPSSWDDMRQHIRHDLREELNNVVDVRKNNRAIKFKIRRKLITECKFESEFFHIGEEKIIISEVAEYLDKIAEELFSIFEEDVQKGYLSANPLKRSG